MASIKNTLILIPMAAAALSGCLSRQPKNDSKQMPGSDRDSHGCIGSAGYTWSEVRQDCIRIFEEGVKMVSATDPQSTLAAYIVFSKDSSQAELFLPGDSIPDVLDRRTLPGGGSAWNIEDDDTKNVREENGRWIIEQRGRTLYTQYRDPILAVFEGTDGKSRRRYRVEVSFYENRAEVTLDGTVFDLPQYRTADGYGYGNDMADLRGRGSEATLKMRDGLTLSLHEAGQEK